MFVRFRIILNKAFRAVLLQFFQIFLISVATSYSGMKRVKFIDAVRIFDGDFEIWCRKFEAVASVCEGDKMVVLPTLLYCRAFDLFAGLTIDDQKNYESVKAALSAAYGPSSQEAFDEFRSQESVEEFMAIESNRTDKHRRLLR